MTKVQQCLWLVSVRIPPRKPIGIQQTIFPIYLTKESRTMNNYTSLDTTSLIEMKNAEKVKTLLPAILYIAILMVSGLLGNLMVCFYYAFKTKPVPTSIFIVTLAVYDLIFCTVSMPTEIADIARFYTFESGAACKILRFINYTASIASALTLVTIATDRFKHIRRATQKQMTVRDAKKYCIIVAGGAVLLSWPILLIYDSEEVPVPNDMSLELKGYDCTFVKSKSYKKFVWAYNVILVVGFIVCTFVLGIMYGMVAWTIKKHRNRLAKYQHDVSHTSEIHMSSDTDAKSTSNNTQQAGGMMQENKGMNNTTSNEETSTEFHDGQTGSEKTVPSDRVKPAKSDSRHNETIKITLLMLAITLVFVVSFLPYLSLIIWRSLTGKHEGQLSDAGLVGFKIGSRSFLLNSSINPWIYGTFNSRFRAYYYKLLCCKRKN